VGQPTGRALSGTTAGIRENIRRLEENQVPLYSAW